MSEDVSTLYMGQWLVAHALYFFFFGFTNSEDGGDALGWTGILVQNVRMSTHVCEDEKQQMRKNKTRTVLEFL